jgi:2-polyprenyl-3-methyl-5-hydroxy-6-metoxy-1,4-benzoquinol methylase
MHDLKNTPNPLLDPFVPAMSSWSLVAAVTIGLFDAIADGEMSPADIAAKIDAKPEAVSRLLDVLICLGYVQRRDGKCRLAEAARQTLVEDAPHQLKNWVRFCRIQLMAMEQLQATVTSGGQVDLFELMNVEGDRLVHQYAMAETAAPAADWVASQIPEPRNRNLILDVGGSHGIYSAAICRRYPPLKAEVLELPSAIETARTVAQELGTVEFVQHVEGDILTTNLTTVYSVVFLANLIHHFRESELEEVINRLHEHTEPGGVVIIWDVAETEGRNDLVASLFSLFFLMTSGAGCHSAEAIERLLIRAGFSEFNATGPPSPSPHLLYTARKA